MVLDLIAYLEPGYRIPSDTHVTHLIERLYVSVKTEVVKLLSNIEFLSITGDIWTSIATDSYLTVTVHYINENWEMLSIALGTLPLSESHTGQNIQSWVKELLNEFDVDVKKVVCFVHDNGANIDLAARMLKDELGWYSLGCAGHTLQLCVNNGLRINRSADRAIAAARRLVTHFRKSEPASRALKGRQADMRTPAHNLIQDVSSRWNSTFFMIERLLEQQWPVTAVLADTTVTKSNDRNLELKRDQWDLLEGLKVVLHPLQVATTYLSAEYNISVSALLPVLFGLVKSLETSEDESSNIRQIKAAISNEIEQRWHLQSLTTQSSNVILISTLLDPQFKQCKFLCTQKQLELKVTLAALLTENGQSQEKQTQSSQAKSQATALDLLLGDESSSDGESDQRLDEVDFFYKKRL